MEGLEITTDDKDDEATLPPPPFQVFCKGLDGKSLTIDTSPEATVLSLKKKRASLSNSNGSCLEANRFGDKTKRH